MNTGKFELLPNSGGYYDQDAEIMNIWLQIKKEFFVVKNDKEFMRYLQKKIGKGK